MKKLASHLITGLLGGFLAFLGISQNVLPGVGKITPCPELNCGDCPTSVEVRYEYVDTCMTIPVDSFAIYKEVKKGRRKTINPKPIEVKDTSITQLVYRYEPDTVYVDSRDTAIRKYTYDYTEGFVSIRSSVYTTGEVRDFKQEITVDTPYIAAVYAKETLVKVPNGEPRYIPLWNSYKGGYAGVGFGYDGQLTFAPELSWQFKDGIMMSVHKNLLKNGFKGTHVTVRTPFETIWNRKKVNLDE